MDTLISWLWFVAIIYGCGKFCRIMAQNPGKTAKTASFIWSLFKK